MPKTRPIGSGQPKCLHCGGMHFGQRFDACPYVRLANDPTATEEERQNATAMLAAHRGPDA